MDHEHGTVCQPILEHQIRPSAASTSSRGPPVSAVVYAAAGRWAQHRSSGAVVTVQRVRRRLQIFRLTYLLTKYASKWTIPARRFFSTPVLDLTTSIPSSLRLNIIIIIINVLIKVTLNVIRCRGTLQSQWSKLTDSTSRKLTVNNTKHQKTRAV